MSDDVQSPHAEGGDGEARQPRSIDRRALLRRGGAVLAGAAGLSAVAGAKGSPASAATGYPVTQGEVNNAGTGITELQSSGAITFKATNTGSGAPVRLTPTATGIPPGSQSGDIRNVDGMFAFTHVGTNDGFSEAIWGEVYTDAWANMMVPLPKPVRVLDTRKDRSHVLDPVGKFDSYHRLIAGKSITVDLSHLVYYGTAAFLNLTVTGSLGGGYLKMWPGGTEPATSAINYSKGQTIANAAVIGLTYGDQLKIKAMYGTTHVVLDVTAFQAGWAGQVLALGTTGDFATKSAPDPRYRQNHQR